MQTADQQLCEQEKILTVIFNAFDEVNQTLPEDRRFKKDASASLLGDNGLIDSLGLTMLIVALEQKIEEEFEKPISLVDVNTMSFENSPFRTVGLLIEHISKLIEG